MHQKFNQKSNLGFKKSVAIIGGGIAGLSCAYYLSQKGYRVTVFEKEKTLGGLLRTKHYQGITYESFYHHIFLNDNILLDLINELGLASKIIWEESSSANYVNSTFFSINSFFDWLRFPGINIIDKIKGGIATLGISSKKAKKYHCMNSYDYIELFFGLSFLNNFWKPLFLKKFHSFAKNISASWFISRLQKRAGSRRRGKEVLGYMDGSFQLLIDKLQSEILQNGGKIHLATEIKNVEKSKALYSVGKNKFDFVVSTLANPTEILNNVLPKKDLNAQNRISYLGVICASIISDKKLLLSG